MKEARQAEVNIGTAGHVDSGKTTIVKALTGEWTDRHSEEIKRGITIRLGYADADVYECGQCAGPEKYSTGEKCGAGHEARFARKISFVDCPGHENLMAVMLSGASLMDGAVLVVAANEKCPQPQTQEHLAALEVAGVKNIVIVQNKLDLVPRERALENYAEIKKFVAGTPAEGAPIVPVAAHYSINVGALLEAIQTGIPTPVRDEAKPLRALVARSFDVNKPGTQLEKLVGGVVGGSIVQGVLRQGDEIEISPGIELKGKYEPLVTKAASIFVRGGAISQARPGGLIGIGTLLDPSLTKSDKLVGNVIGKPGTLPKPTSQISFEAFQFERGVGEEKPEKVRKGEVLVINSGTALTVGTATNVKKDVVEMALKRAVCVEPGGKVAVSRRVKNRWCLIGYGAIR